MSRVNLITSGATLLSGTVEECLTPDDETCVGGIASVMAFVRNNTRGQSEDGDEPYTMIQKFDKNSPFVNMHPLQWVVNRLVLREIFGLDVFLSTPSLLLQNKVDSSFSVSQRDISDLQTTDMPLLITNVEVAPSHSWHHYTRSVYFDHKTGLAVANIAHQNVPLAIDHVAATRGFLNHVHRINMENGCFVGESDKDSGGSNNDGTATGTAPTISYAEYLIENPIVQFANSGNTTSVDSSEMASNSTVEGNVTAQGQETDVGSNNNENRCWITVILYDDIEASYWRLLEEIVFLENPPDLVVNLEAASYETFPTPQLYANSTTWVSSCPMEDDVYCQHRITFVEDGDGPTMSPSQELQLPPPRKPTISTIDFIYHDLETLPSELKDELWVQNILQLRPLADAAQQNDPVVGYSEAMPVSRVDEYRACMAGECPLGSLFTDAIRWFTGTDIAFTSSGGYRGEGWSQGPVQLTDMYAALPFPNTECSGTMSGLSLFALMNYTTSVATFEGHDSDEGGLLLQVSGLKVTYNTKLNESRLLSVDVWDDDEQAYLPLDRTKMYTFSTDSYVCGAYESYPELTGGNFRIDGEIPGEIGENLVQNIVADYLGQLDEPWTFVPGRLVNDTSNFEVLNLIQTSDSCPPNYVWKEDSLTCFECPSFKNVVFSDELLNFEADSSATILDTGRILLINREVFDAAVKLKSKPSWIEFTSAGMESGGVDLSGSSPISLSSGDTLALTFLLRTSALGSGLDRTALGAVSFSVDDNGSYPGCSGLDASFEVYVRLTPPDEYNFLGNFFYIGLAFAMIVALTAFSFTGFVFAYRNSRVVKVMQPSFLVTICLGVAIMGSSMIPIGIDDGLVPVSGVNIACMSTPWLLSSGFTCAFSALFSKLWRINQLFNSTSAYRRVVVRPQDVLKPFLMLFSINTALLIAWTIVDPLKWERFDIDGQEWNTYGTCVGGNAATVFVSLIAAVNVAALLMTCIQAYSARNISDEFSESKYIGIAIYGWLQTALIGVPILFLINKDNPTAQYFLQVGLIFVISMSMVSIVFVPAFVNFKKHGQGKSTGRVSVSGISGINAADAGWGSQSSEFHKVELKTAVAMEGQNPGRPVQMGFMDSIEEGSESASDLFQQNRMSGTAENIALTNAVLNRQKMIERPIDLQDTSMNERVKQMMAVMEVDSSNDSSDDGDSVHNDDVPQPQG
jgi:hypothetical protein